MGNVDPDVPPSVAPRSLAEAARSGKLSRRDVLKRAIALGLSAPAIAALLAACGSSSSSIKSSSSAASASSGGTTASSSPAGSGESMVGTPSTAPEASATTASSGATGKRGGEGTLRVLYWQAPTVLNPAFSSGTKDLDASRLVLEPLLDFNKDNEIVPVLAAEVPSLDNGQVAKDGNSVTLKLRQGVTWHDGTPFTADDVVFTWQYNANKDIASTWFSYYQRVKTVEAVDAHTVTFTFTAPYAAWWKVGVPYTLPKHKLEKSLENPNNAKTDPFNLKPVGTGPYMVESFKPGDTGIYAINQNYWDPGKPHFDTINMKGGGNATSAARAVMQTDDADWAWNLQVDPSVLEAMASGGKGKVVTAPGGGCERFLINHADPNTESEGQKAYYKVPHPHFKNLQVRQALSYLLDRKTIAEKLYGPGGSATGSTYNFNPVYMPDGITNFEYNIDKANTLLDQAGATKGSDGIRTLNGRKMSWTYQTSTNDVRQKTQEIVKASFHQAGLDLQLKAIDAAIFFGATDNPGSENAFFADIEMETTSGGTYPDLWLLWFYSEDPATYICQKSNSWGASNFIRYQSEKFNTLYDQAIKEIDPAKYRPLFQQLIQMVTTEDISCYGLVSRNSVSAAAGWLDGYQNRGASTYSELSDIKSWYKKA